MEDPTVLSLLSLFVIPDKYFLDQHPWLKTCSKTPTGKVWRNYIIFLIFYIYIFYIIFMTLLKIPIIYFNNFQSHILALWRQMLWYLWCLSVLYHFGTEKHSYKGKQWLTKVFSLIRLEAFQTQPVADFTPHRGAGVLGANREWGELLESRRITGRLRLRIWQRRSDKVLCNVLWVSGPFCCIDPMSRRNLQFKL